MWWDLKKKLGFFQTINLTGGQVIEEALAQLLSYGIAQVTGIHITNAVNEPKGFTIKLVPLVKLARRRGGLQLYRQ